MTDCRHIRLRPLEARLAGGDRLLIAGLGDSLTYGWDVSRGFFDRAVDLLAERYPEAALGRLNAGVPGDTAPGGQRRLSSVLARAPDLVVIQFGLNDWACGLGIEAFENAMRSMAETIQNRGLTPLLATSPLPAGRLGQGFLPFCDAIRAVGAGLGVPVADLDRAFEAAHQDLHTDDGVHPNDRGHSVMAVALASLF